MIEMIVGLIALVVLFAGLLQIASLALAQSRTLSHARRSAAIRAMSSPTLVATPDFISEIRPGADESMYSVDDERVATTPIPFRDTVVAPSAASSADWTIVDRARGNAVSAMHSAAIPTAEFGMVKGRASETVPVIDAIQHMVYDDTEIDIESEVWMPWLRGIY